MTQWAMAGAQKILNPLLPAPTTTYIVFIYVRLIASQQVFGSHLSLSQPLAYLAQA